MNQPLSDWEGRVQDLARTFTYPPTPDLSRWAAVESAASKPTPTRWSTIPRWAWAVAIILALMAGLLAVPGVRAAVVEVLRLGAVRVFLNEPTPPPAEEQDGPLQSGTRSTPTVIPLPSLLNLAGETTLAAARQQTPFPILLPAYPADLGEPDRVYVQNLDGPTVVLVWLSPEEEDTAKATVRLSLTQIGAGVSFDKHNVRQIEETLVDGRWALWIDGPHLLQTRSGGQIMQRLVQQGHVLLWEQGGVTFRLETDLPLPEARNVAESLADGVDH